MGDSILIKTVCRGALAIALGFAVAPAGAQERVDEVIVTGSYIKHTPEDAPVPVDVVDSEELFNIGNPSVVELVKTLGVSSGVDGETNQFQSNGLEGTANINLRGLGAGRNLVLLNGRRNVFSPYPVAEQQQLFVDINMIPAVALDRVELLKDGAAATYGSDAISGVVNFITRDDFEVFEFALSHKDIDGSDGDQDLGGIWGRDFGQTHIMAALGYNKRNQLQVTERDWTIRPRGEDANLRGYSSSPNPGAFLRVNAFTEPSGNSISRTREPSQADIRWFNHDDDSGTAEVTPANAFLDPRCTDISGSFAANDGRCTYAYTYFDNLIEVEERINLFGVLTHDLDDNMQMKVEFLYGENEVPEWWTSPSYPPQLDFDTRYDTGRYVYAWHPGLERLGETHPDLRFGDTRDDNGVVTSQGALVSDAYDADCDVTNDAYGCRQLLFYGRPLGASGPTEKRGSREYETMRLAFGLEGEFDSGTNYTTSIIFTEAEGKRFSYDALSERWSEALEGYGLCGRFDAEGAPRPVSDRADQAGANAGCEFYNPFSNAIERPQQKFTADFVNPDFEEDLANSNELYEWMSVPVGTEVESSLLVWDGVLSGEAANGVGWAFGAQYREEDYVVSPNAITNLHINPCATVAENEEFREANRAYNPDGENCAGEDGTFGTDDDYTGSGSFTFLAGTTPFDETQDITAIFGEVNIPFTDNLDTQLSVRYEDYGGSVGDTIDPKVAIRWQASERIVVRSSASSTFRGPTLNQLGGRTTALSFLNAVGTFKAIDALGNPDLEPETANTFNTGVIFSDEGVWRDSDIITVSLDYWRFDFENPIIREDFNAIASRSFVNREFSTAAAGVYADRISCGARLCQDGDSIGSISRIKTSIINGPDIETDGLDIAASYGMPAWNGDMEFSLQWTHIASFDIGKSDLSDGFDANGRINDTVSFLRPIVENKAKFGVKYDQGVHTLNFVTNYTDSYQDADSIVGIPLTAIFGSGIRKEVEDHITYDLHYNLSLASLNDGLEESAMWVSIYNLTDEDPPRSRTDLNYDPYTHNPFGRIIKVGVRHRF